jgi:hypothetical protein
MGPEMPVAIKLANSTVGGALAAGIRPRLEAIEMEGHLVVRLMEPDPMRAQSHTVKDLTDNEIEQAAEVADLMRAIVEPALWNENTTMEVAGDVLKIRQRSAVQVQLFILAEKLRTARGLPHSARWTNRELFKLDTRSELAKDKLAAPVTANFNQPTNFVRILQHLEQAAGVRILVDWRDVAAAGWNPDGEATLAVEKQPLAAALTALVEPMDLAWRIVDGRTLQVVRPETLHSRCELELYPVGTHLKNDPAGETLLSLVRTTLGEEQFKGGGGPGEIRCDPAGQCLIVWLPQPRQQELAGLLAKWASTGAAE